MGNGPPTAARGALALLVWSLEGFALPHPTALGQGPAGTDARESAAQMERARQARQHFADGMAAFRERQYEPAITAFEAARELIPSADLSYNIARAQEELAAARSGTARAELLDAAAESYRRYLRDRVDPPDREDLEAHIERLLADSATTRAAAAERPTSGRVRFRSAVRAELDQQPVDAQAGLEVTVTAGPHALRAEPPGAMPFVAQVTVEPGMTAGAAVAAIPRTQLVAVRDEPVWAFISWGLAGAGLGATIGLGIEAASRRDSDLNGARTWAAWSDAALAGTIGLSLLGAVLYIVELRAVRTEVVRR